jgi:hypothetical protein
MPTELKYMDTPNAFQMTASKATARNQSGDDEGKLMTLELLIDACRNDSVLLPPVDRNGPNRSLSCSVYPDRGLLFSNMLGPAVGLITGVVGLEVFPDKDRASQLTAAARSLIFNNCSSDLISSFLRLRCKSSQEQAQILLTNGGWLAHSGTGDFGRLFSE